MRVVLGIAIALFCPLAALMIVLSPAAVQLLAEATIVAPAGEKDSLVSIALAVRDYSLGNDAANLPHGSDYRTAMTPDALSHLLDVRVVFIACEVGFVVVTLALIALLVIAAQRGKRRPAAPPACLDASHPAPGRPPGTLAALLARPLIVGGVVPLAAAALLASAVAIDFSAFFTWMHGIFFAAGTWTFPADSLLIRALPTQFWLDCALLWAGSMVVLCVASVATGGVLAHKNKRGTAAKTK